MQGLLKQLKVDGNMPAKATKAETTVKTAETAKAPSARGSRAKSGTASKAQPADGDGAADQGIWQRFTSGRTTRKRTVKEPPAEG